MGFRIQVRRGPEEALPALASGEFGLAQDTRRLFLGTPIGNDRIASYRDVLNYVDFTYRDMQSLVRDVAYLKLMVDTGDRISEGTTFGTNFDKSFNITQEDKFVAVGQAVSASVTSITLPDNPFVAGEFATIYDADGMEEIRIASVSGNKITLGAPLANSYDAGAQIALTTLGADGTFDAKRYADAELQLTNGDVSAGDLTGASGRRSPNVAITNDGVVVAALKERNTIEIKSLDMKNPSAQWVTSRYITAPAGTELGVPVLAHSRKSNKVALLFHHVADKNFRFYEFDADKYYAGNLYDSAYIITPPSPIRSLSDYTMVTSNANFVDERFLFAMSFRSDRFSSTTNVASTAITINSITGNPGNSTFIWNSQSNTVGNDSHTVTPIDVGFGRDYTKGVSQYFFIRANKVIQSYPGVTTQSSKELVSSTGVTRKNLTSVYVHKQDMLNDSDHGSIHVAWEEVSNTNGATAIMHMVSLDKGETFSTPVSVVSITPSIEKVSNPFLTVGAGGDVFVVYRKETESMDDSLSYGILYKQVQGGLASGPSASDVGATSNFTVAHNPTVNLTAPVTLYYAQVADRTRVRGSFTRDITIPKLINHLRFKLDTLGTEVAMWVKHVGDFDVMAHVNGDVMSKQVLSDELEFTHGEMLETEFFVTLTLVRDTFGETDWRIEDISGGVS